MWLRREPFRLLFPLGALIGLCGVLPWLLFGVGLTRGWLGLYHAHTLTQSFLLAIAAGFLGTMLPRRSGGPPLSALELTLLAAALVAIPPALLFNRLLVAELAYLVALGTLLWFALSRLGHMRQGSRGVPPTFVLIPCALFLGLAGAVSLIAFSLGAPPALFLAGRALVQEGVLLPLVMALAPMLTPIILDGEAAPIPGPRALHAGIALAFAVSFLLSVRGGELLRGLLVAVECIVVSGVVRRPALPGLHRRLYQLSLLLVPVGLLAAAALPTARLPLLHLTFVGGLSLMVFAVGSHVTFLHTGHEPLASGRPWPIALVGALTLAAALVRAGAEFVGASHYVRALTVAAGLWLVGVIVWVAYLLPMLVAPKPAGGHAPKAA